MFRIDNAKIEAGGCNTKGKSVHLHSFDESIGGDVYCFQACDLDTDTRTKEERQIERKTEH